MELNQQRLTHFAPFALPIVLLLGGWFFIVQPRFTDATRAGREIDGLRQRLMMARASVADPAPAQPTGREIAAFEREVASGDASAELLEQLARLAAGAQVSNLLIETGNRVVVSGRPGAGPQPQADDDAALADPRLVLFDRALAYSPVTMSFDADFARLGDLLWQVRDLATTVEIRSVTVTPRSRAVADAPVAQDGRVHVSLTLLAYSREREPEVERAGGAAR